MFTIQKPAQVKVSIQRRLFNILTPVCLALVTFAIYRYSAGKLSKPTLELSNDDLEPVRAVTYDVTVNAPGDIRSANNTTVECEIERMAVYTQGRSMVTKGSTRILKLIPDGSYVKKGDVLCQLDSRDLEEVVRLQKINLQQAMAMQKYTEMDMEVSNIMLQEYLQGSAKQRVQALNAQIALANFDASRITGRLAWSRRMYDKGYLSKTTVRAEELALQRSDMMLTQAQTALKTFEKYTLPKTEHSFKSRILSQKYLLTYYQRWVNSQNERLKKFEEQVAKCTVRAPHDGLIVYANEDDGDTRVEVGSEMRQGQDLFFLPDLKNMQVLAKLNESVVEKVKEGMPVNVLVQSLDQRQYTGKVEKVAEFPIPPSSWRSSPEVKSYYCVVNIEGAPEDLRPGLNAEIKIMTGSEVQALAVSPDVVHVENDKEFCFVKQHDGSIEKREIRTRTGDPGNLEILEGLKEGELVIRTPNSVEENPGVVDRVVSLPDRPWSEKIDSEILHASLGLDQPDSSTPADENRFENPVVIQTAGKTSNGL